MKLLLVLVATIVGANADLSPTKNAYFGVKGGHRNYENEQFSYTQNNNRSQFGRTDTEAMTRGRKPDQEPGVGVCFIEVPTSALVRNPSQVPAGNGSSPDMSRIRSCCKGYIRNIHNYLLCDPVCSSGCVNANCIAPEVCACFPDHVQNTAGFCVAQCPIGCQNGRCAGGECICRDGYRLDVSGRFCEPSCADNCGGSGVGNCTAPNTCSCKPGYENTSSGSCQRNNQHNPLQNNLYNSNYPHNQNQANFTNNPYNSNHNQRNYSNPNSQQPQNSYYPNQPNNENVQHYPSGQTYYPDRNSPNYPYNNRPLNFTSDSQIKPVQPNTSPIYNNNQPGQYPSNQYPSSQYPSNQHPYPNQSDNRTGQHYPNGQTYNRGDINPYYPDNQPRNLTSDSQTSPSQPTPRPIYQSSQTGQYPSNQYPNQGYDQTGQHYPNGQNYNPDQNSPYYPGSQTNPGQQNPSPNYYGNQPGQYPANQHPYWQPIQTDQSDNEDRVPRCSQPCINGVCVQGNRCSCNPGYELDNTDPSGTRCHPHCAGGCQNGVCSAPNFCICNMGYRKEQGVKGGAARCVKRMKRSLLDMIL